MLGSIASAFYETQRPTSVHWPARLLRLLSLCSSMQSSTFRVVGELVSLKLVTVWTACKELLFSGHS